MNTLFQAIKPIITQFHPYLNIKDKTHVMMSNISWSQLMKSEFIWSKLHLIYPKHPVKGASINECKYITAIKELSVVIQSSEHKSIAKLMHLLKRHMSTIERFAFVEFPLPNFKYCTPIINHRRWLTTLGSKMQTYLSMNPGFTKLTHLQIDNLSMITHAYVIAPNLTHLTVNLLSYSNNNIGHTFMNSCLYDNTIHDIYTIYPQLIRLTLLNLIASNMGLLYKWGESTKIKPLRELYLNGISRFNILEYCMMSMKCHHLIIQFTNANELFTMAMNAITDMINKVPTQLTCVLSDMNFSTHVSQQNCCHFLYNVVTINLPNIKQFNLVVNKWDINHTFVKTCKNEIPFCNILVLSDSPY